MVISLTRWNIFQTDRGIEIIRLFESDFVKVKNPINLIEKKPATWRDRFINQIIPVSLLEEPFAVQFSLHHLMESLVGGHLQPGHPAYLMQFLPG